MSGNFQQKTRQRLTEETGVRSKPWGGRLSVALVFPNTYHQAMSNLGFLTVYRMLNERPDSLCERFFLPDPEDLKSDPLRKRPLQSLESGRCLSDFDLVAFSIAFENDYLNLPLLFELGRLPFFAAERSAQHPLVLCGGVCAFLNPEPLAEVMDLFAVGEAEMILDGLIETLQQQVDQRDKLLLQLGCLPGVYFPAGYQVSYHADGRLASCDPIAKRLPKRVRRQWLPSLAGEGAEASVLTRETEFGDLYLTEVSRGCSRGCRFCAAGYIYLPERERPLDDLRQSVARGLQSRRRIGLVGAAVSDYSALPELCGGILKQGGEISLASLRIDSITETEVASLKTSGHKTVSLAPEAGSQRMRDLINKQLSEEQIVHAVELLAEGGIQNLKLYYLIGLPEEADSDIEELLQLTRKLQRIWLEVGRSRGRLGSITLSVNPFIPKPFTPLQWAPMAPQADLKRSISLLRKAINRLPNVQLQVESPRSALLQGFLARGDRRLARLLPSLAAGGNLRQVCREAGLDLDACLGQRQADELLPWEVIDNGVRRDYLWSEYRKGLAGEMTSRCAPGCRRCGVCG